MAVNLFEPYSASDYFGRATNPRYLDLIVHEHFSIMNLPIQGTFENFEKYENLRKNRDVRIPCWDSSRVILKSNCDVDYIHANYVSGFDGDKKFVATQEPTAETLCDFFTMIWQENSYIVVMLTDTAQNSEPICPQYWSSNEDCDAILKIFKVSANKVTLHRFYTEITLNILNKETGELRIIHFFKYFDSPSHGVPSNMAGFLDFILAINKRQQSLLRKALVVDQNLPGPIVVHCSSGIGTGTLCALDACLYQLAITVTINVPAVVFRIRHQRHSSILSPEQYVFINNVLLYFIATMRTNIWLLLELRSHLFQKDLHLFLV
ncbi:protein tyrosine phosphatase N4 [Microplitis demolitor]|uniref:tyrosine-protein phosphatase non-receptor type 9 n=1 Tax=Microplitis demolitor TaxID=69319 RepID=UPI00044003BE|nr:tyrosine-protein phosphatase non-receptor type 9 [Microplitis demolitor]KAG6558331.1 protein tyrosine phosphatase N4 [Microplitis demolitor]